MNTDNLDPTRCPRCGEPNQCALACPDAAADGSCWCFEITLAPSTLASLPAGEQGKRCLCRRCAEAG